MSASTEPNGLPQIADATAIVSASEVSRRYGEGEAAVDALNEVSVELPAGRYAAIMGPSGSGKSTLMHILAGLDRPTSGTVRIDGVELTHLSDRELTQLRRDRIGFIFQTFNLLPVLSAEENILLPLSIAGRCRRPRLVRPADRHGRHPRPSQPSPGRALGRPAAARRGRAGADLAPVGRVRR